MFTYIGKLIATGLIAIATLFSPHIIEQPTPLAGAVNAVGGKVYYLAGSGVSSSASTIILTNFDVAGGTTNLTMSDFGDKGCGTIEPGHSTRQEFISFTGLTQNADGTATLSGVSRGLSPVPPYTASSTQQKAHSGGSQFVISNSPPCFYEGYASLSQDEAVTGLWSFNSYLPTTSITATTSNQFTNKSYVDGVALVSAPVSDETTKGVVELGTQIEMASSTILGSTLAPLVLQSKYSTSSPYTTGLFIPITRNDGKLNPNFIATTSNDIYNWAGLSTFTGGLTSLIGDTKLGSTSIPFLNIGVITSTSTAATTATSTITNLKISNNATTTDLFVSGTCYGCPTTYTASSTDFSASSGTVTFTGSIPTNANLGIGKATVNLNSTTYADSFTIAREGMTSATILERNNGGSDTSTYTLTWTGSNFVVQETADANTNSSISGTIYWYK